MTHEEQTLREKIREILDFIVEDPIGAEISGDSTVAENRLVNLIHSEQKALLERLRMDEDDAECPLCGAHHANQLANEFNAKIDQELARLENR